MTVSYALRATLALTGSELRLLWRNRLVAAVAIVMPLGLGVMFATGDLEVGPSSWGSVAALQLVVMLLLTVYTAATTTIAARRRALVLKRLRSGEAPDGAILAGMLLPTIAIAVVQGLLLCGVVVAFGAPAPEQPLLLVPAVLGGALVCAAVALLTARITPSAEMAQITTMPFFLAATAGTIWVLSVAPDDVTRLMTLAPGGTIADLIRCAWVGGGDPLLDLVGLAVWIAVAFDLSRRVFRWEPRS